MKKLAIITSHPIQYYAPVFQLLHARGQVEIMVFYTWGSDSIHKFDPGFDKKIEWDVPLLNGYPYEWAENTSKDPGTHHFKGIVNPGLIGQINGWKPDALLIYGWGFHSHLRVLRYFKNKIPVLFRGDSTLLDSAKGVNSILRGLFLKWVYRHVDYALYPGYNTKAYFKKAGLKDSQLSFAPHAVDNKRFAEYRSREALLIRKSLLINEDKIVILFAGKMEEKKAPVNLLESFLKMDDPETHLLFVGNGPLENQLKQLAKNHERIHFIDFQNQLQMPVIYQVCDLFCLPSVGPGETWGLAINEAMASGKAILASDRCGGAVDLIKPGVNGEIFKAGMLNDLTAKLNKLTGRGKEALKEMGFYSKQLIEHWSFEKQVMAIEAVAENE